MDRERGDMNAPAYNYQTASEWLRIKPGKLKRLVERRKITFVRIGREIRFRQEDLDQFVSECVCPRKEEVGRWGTP